MQSYLPARFLYELRYFVDESTMIPSERVRRCVDIVARESSLRELHRNPEYNAMHQALAAPIVFGDPDTIYEERLQVVRDYLKNKGV